MNILFLTLLDFNYINERNIYLDLLREFKKCNHNIYIISPIERRTKKKTKIIKDDNVEILKLKVGNIQKTNIIEKGISTVMLEKQFIRGIEKYFLNVNFNLVLYSTPPVTFCNIVEYVKRRDGAKSYLLLKDIFPQNAVDLKMLKKNGVFSFIYKFFREKEKKLYAISDAIGCMSPANCKYILSHNPELKSDKVELCPNSIEPLNLSLSSYCSQQVREKYGLPKNKKLFVYGGNLGRPQNVPFIVKCLEACSDINDVFFVIAGNGTDRHYLEEYIRDKNPRNVKLLGLLPKEEYDAMIACCDIGLIFLDHRFTIPNFPSRLLSYMQAGLPILACTDNNTDIGKVITAGGFGLWCESNSENNFKNLINKLLKMDLKPLKERGYEYLLKHYTSQICYETIINRINDLNR